MDVIMSTVEPKLQRVLSVMLVLFACVGSQMEEAEQRVTVLGKAAIPVSIFVWTAVYLGIEWCTRVPGAKLTNGLTTRLVDGYPMWNWITGILHGLVILPALFWLYVAAVPDAWLEPSATPASPPWSWAWSWPWLESILSMPLFKLPIIRSDALDLGAVDGSGAHLILEQTGCAVIGFLLKDLFLPMQWAFMIHHLLAVAGVMASIVFPTAGGLTLFCVCQVEAGSSIFDVYAVAPSKATLLLYTVGMSMSNYLGSKIIIEVTHMAEVGLWWRVLYGITGWGLIVLRWAGLANALVSALSAAPKKSGTDADTDAKKGN